MPTITLTDAAVKKLSAPPGKRIEYFDRAMGGLVLRVGGPVERPAPGGGIASRPGSRTWGLYYRGPGGKLVRLGLGRYPAISLAEARHAATEALRARERGSDPRAAKRAARDEAAREAADTIESVMELFVRRHLETKHRAPSYISTFRAMFENHVLPHWRGRPIASITRQDVVHLLDRVTDGGTKVRQDGKTKIVAGGPIVANRVLAAVRVMFGWAARRGMIENSPAAYVTPPGQERRKDRALSDDEVSMFWAATEGTGLFFRELLRVALLTGQRRGEIAAMRWTDLHLTEKVWTIPREVTKNKKGDHVVPLADAVVDILRALPRVSIRDPATGKPVPSNLVFSTTGETPVSGFGRATDRLQKNMQAEAKRCAVDGAEPIEVASFTIHDLRRSCATGMARCGTSHFVIARVLNHTDSTVTGIYNRHDYLAEKRAALDAWAAHIVKLTSPPAAGAAASAERRPDAEAGPAVAASGGGNVVAFRRH